MNAPIRPANHYAGKGILAPLLVLLLSASCAKAAYRPHHVAGNPPDSFGAAISDSDTAVRNVRVSPKLPPYRFVLTRDPAASNTPQGRQRVGRIDISKGNSTKVLQSIEVDGTDPNWFQSSFHTLDINFDGYLDFAVVYEVGGKWHSESYWLFDPASGRYITNALTGELRKLEHNGLTLNPQKKEIRTSLFIGVCLKSFRIHRVENGHLVLMESEIHSPREPGRCLVEKRKRVNGEMMLTENKEQKHEVAPSLREP